MKKLFPLLLLTVVTMAACTHDPGTIIAIGGTGGSAVLNVYPQHHTKASTLDSCKVYVKYNTLDAPANGVYDDSISCVTANGYVMGTFTGLKNGNYYFYGTGYDYNISERVKGGLPYTITQQQSQDFDLPVSEE